MSISKETLRMIIREGQEQIRDVQLYERPFTVEANGRYVLVGVRQAGKSYMLYRRAKQLLAEGHRPEEFLYIDFNDERLLEMTALDFDVILQTYKATYPYQPILMLDEIQNVSGWEHFARRMANMKYMVYITGSNAKMLSRDIHTTLGGRYLDRSVYPYSFAEYLGAQGVQLSAGWMYGSERFKVEQLFNEYLMWGGFPELLLYHNKRRWLNDVYEKILLNDVVVRNKIKNEMALRLTIKRLTESVSKPISYNRIANLIKNTGTNTTTSSIIQYVEAAKEAFIIFSLDNYASKFVEKATIKKHYFIDNGLLGIFLSDTIAPLFENLCAIHLYRKYENRLYYYSKNIEVDFYIPEEKCAIQACVDLTDDDTKRREVDGLVKLDRLENLNRMIIVTQDTDDIITTPNGKQIVVVPIWKWLLQEEE